jgi:hypothetical protein
MTVHCSTNFKFENLCCILERRKGLNERCDKNKRHFVSELVTKLEVVFIRVKVRFIKGKL